MKELDKDRFLASGLLEQYILGLTTPEESAEVERYSRAFPEIREEIDSTKRAIKEYALAHSIPSRHTRKPDPLLKSPSSSGSGSPGKKKINNPSSAFGFRLASLIAIGLAVWSTLLFQERKQLHLQHDRLEAEYEMLKTACQKELEQKEQKERLYALLTEKDTKHVHLAGTMLAPECSVFVYWNEEKQKGYLDAIHLPQPPAGKQYQIWADVNGEMINIGLVETSAVFPQTVKFIPNAKSINITLEPAGGSEHPSVELLMANGKIS